MNPRFAMFGNVELNGLFRGRSVPIEAVRGALSGRLPWVPANVTLSPSNTIPPDNPFGPYGETRLMPDPSATVTLPARAEQPAMAVFLADIVQHDGSFWEACGRMQLKRALARLSDAGLTLMVGFEQECFIYGLTEESAPAFSLAGSRNISGLAEEVLATLATAGTHLDQFMAEYGPHQFELAAPVRPALRAADEAVITREVVRDAARARGAHATFAPKPDPALVGSGVHIHMSLHRDGDPVTAREDALTEPSAAFVAGILNHLDAVMAYTTPSPNSFERLKPSSWVGVYKCFGVRNREAAIRLVPRTAEDGDNRKASIEFRLTDGAANPYLALAALVHAGLDGLSRGLPAPRSVEVDPGRLSDADREAAGLTPVVGSLEEALKAAEETADAWFGPLFREAYWSARANEIADAKASENYFGQIARVI